MIWRVISFFCGTCNSWNMLTIFWLSLTAQRIPSIAWLDIFVRTNGICSRVIYALNLLYVCFCCSFVLSVPLFQQSWFASLRCCSVSHVGFLANFVHILAYMMIAFAHTREPTSLWILWRGDRSICWSWERVCYHLAVEFALLWRRNENILWRLNPFFRRLDLMILDDK